MSEYFFKQRYKSPNLYARKITPANNAKPINNSIAIHILLFYINYNVSP